MNENRIHAIAVDSMPPLAWVAQLTPGKLSICVVHGQRVEITPDWFCEAVWDGSFEAGDFDLTDIVAGSGARCRDDKITFVSSGSTVDRLCYLREADRILVSNSIPAVLATSGVELDPAWPRYFEFFFSVIKGLGHYEHVLPAGEQSVEVTYFDNLLWDGRDLMAVSKPRADRRFAAFDDYFGFLDRSMGALVRNMTDPTRAVRYELLGTLSSGYDSTTVASLGVRHGLRQVISIHAPGGDDGGPIARALGLDALRIQREAWRARPYSEVPFIAGDSFGEEVHFCVAEDHLTGRILLTGYHGDKVWEKQLPSISPDLVRGDLSGLAHSEYRLWAGYLHCPVPFWGARGLADIHRISNSEEMQPWDVGGDYNRPICRRIADMAGVSQEAFGQRKAAASRWLHQLPAYLTDASAADLLAWLGDRRAAWRGLRRPPILHRGYDRQRMKLLVGFSYRLFAIPGFFKLGLNRIRPLHRLATMHNSDQKRPPHVFGFRRYVFAWAASRAADRYRDAAVRLRKADCGKRDAA